jgi:acetyl esterase/lipase
MKTVWKFPLEGTGRNVIRMPANAEILHVGMQGGIPCVWAYVESMNEKEDRVLFVHGTGWEMSNVTERPTYHGTAHTDESLVWHVFELSR